MSFRFLSNLNLNRNSSRFPLIEPLNYNNNNKKNLRIEIEVQKIIIYLLPAKKKWNLILYFIQIEFQQISAFFFLKKN